MQGSRGELMEHCGVGAAAVPVSCSEQGALLFCILCAWSFICFGVFFRGGGEDGGEAKSNRAPRCVQWELAWIWERHPRVAGEKRVLLSVFRLLTAILCNTCRVVLGQGVGLPSPPPCSNCGVRDGDAPRSSLPLHGKTPPEEKETNKSILIVRCDVGCLLCAVSCGWFLVVLY